jgi:DNA-binding CsgD family transcriptional regulator
MTKSNKKKQAAKKGSPYIYRYETQQNPVYFSVREAQCANHFKDKRTIEEIAKLLNISSKTVEYYLDNMKTKLGCYDKQELIEILKDLDLDDP